VPDQAQQGQARGRGGLLPQLIVGQPLAFEGQGGAVEVEEPGQGGSFIRLERRVQAFDRHGTSTTGPGGQ
jgi:hypothetical protein